MKPEFEKRTPREREQLGLSNPHRDWVDRIVDLAWVAYVACFVLIAAILCFG